MIIYGDLLAGINFLVDFLLLMAADRLAGCPGRIWKAALAATAGGVYALVCILPGFRFLGNLFWRTLALMGMGLIAYGTGRLAGRRCILFVILSMALGGTASGLGGSGGWKAIGAAGILFLLCRAGFRGKPGRSQYLPVELTWGNTVRTVTALVDTGNTLRDPLTGEAVLVTGWETAEGLLGLGRDEIACPVETLMKRPVPGLRLIPYTAVGQPRSMLLGIRCDKVRVNGKESRMIVAFAPQNLGQGRAYQALIGGAI